MFFRFAISHEPKNEPAGSQASSNEKSPAPTPMNRNPRHDQGGDNRPDICARVKNSNGKGPLLLRKPFGNALYAGRKNSSFSETQPRTRRQKASKGSRRRVAHRSQTPKCHGQCITDSRSQSIDEPPDHNHPQGISCLKGKYQVSIINLVPAQIVLKRCFEHTENLAVHVILGDTQQQKCADHPTEISVARPGSYLGID